MNRTPLTRILVDIAQANPSRAARRAHPQFPTRVRTLDRPQPLLQAWGETIPRSRCTRAAEYRPRQPTDNAHPAEWVRLFDHAAGPPAFTKRDRRLSSNASRGPSVRRAWHP